MFSPRISPLPTWIDAHNHLQDSLLTCLAEEVVQRVPAHTLSLVNGTSPLDWSSVAQAANKAPTRILPAFGVHPWKTAACTGHWLADLENKLERPNASLGEIGLDRWIPHADIPLQIRILQQQLELVESRHCAISLHCLKAWPELRRIAGSWLQQHPRPCLLHAYGGPREEVDFWLDHGAYFSFSAYFLHPHKQPVRKLFQQLPLTRLLVETDAPSMAPPTLNGFTVLSNADGSRINLPANIIPTYQALADLRSIPIEQLQQQVQQNFLNFYWHR